MWERNNTGVGDARAIIGGRSVVTVEITGVLTRLTHIWEQELVQIVAEDRRYVVAEMSAFLMSWLSALDCPVLNRPVPGCLSGPSWRPEQWAAAATRADMRVAPQQHQPCGYADTVLRQRPGNNLPPRGGGITGTPGPV